MDESYFLQKFDEYERNDSWDHIFHKINLESVSQARKLSLCCDLSNKFHEKNRYRNVLPYDQNRIMLRKGVSSEIDSYINASSLHLPFARRNYILTQGPLPNTACDFWQMIYEQGVSICIMLSKVIEKNFIKCHSYFPCKEDKKLQFDKFECQLEHEDIKSNYIIRRIKLTPSENFKKVISSASDCTSHRIIHHFQFTTWPDFGVPEHTDHFLEFLEEVRNTRERLLKKKEETNCANPPILCHCSAGIGRTGTFVIVDSILSMFEKRRNEEKDSLITHSNNANEVADQKVEKQLDSLEALVVFIRQHRMGLIQTPQQLRFCWKTIVDWIKKDGDQTKANNHPSSQKETNENMGSSNKSSPASHRRANNDSPLDIACSASNLSPLDIAATVTDIRWTMNNDPLDVLASSPISLANSNNGAAHQQQKFQSDENHTSDPANSIVATPSSSVIRARKRSNNEQNELASAPIISPNSPATSPRPLSMEQQKRTEHHS